MYILTLHDNNSDEEIRELIYFDEAEDLKECLETLEELTAVDYAVDKDFRNLYVFIENLEKAKTPSGYYKTPVASISFNDSHINIYRTDFINPTDKEFCEIMY